MSGSDKKAMDQVTKDAESLKLDDSAVPDITAMLPELPPGRTLNAGKTLEETVADLKKHPLFMTELDASAAEDNELVAALQALAYEGTPLENAANFREQGNECFREKRWADAKEFYTKGVAILAAEEARRAKGLRRKVKKSAAAAQQPPEGKDDAGGEPSRHQNQQRQGSGGERAGEEEAKAGEEGEEEEEVEVEDDPAETARERALLETLYVNRAACHLSLRNYRSCTTDCAAALRLNPANIKAFYRSARALLAVGRVDEADDACARGLALDAGNQPLRALAAEIAAAAEAAAAKRRVDEERAARERKKEALLRAALQARNIRLRATPGGKGPDLEDARVRLAPDEEDPASALVFPTLLLYPAHAESDFIKAFSERESLEQHFGYVFPLPWDRTGEYSSATVECYMETAAGGLVKVGKKVPLLQVLSGGNVEVVDGLVKVFVVPRGRAEAWVREWKERKAAGGGAGR